MDSSNQVSVNKSTGRIMESDFNSASRSINLLFNP